MTDISGASKDDLVLAAVAVLGGENYDVNERDAFLACWHAFPNTMRWVDTALPNPETFTASLRRLEQRGYVRRLGKQQRATSRLKGAPKRTPLEVARSGVVKTRIVEDGLSKAGVTPDLVEAVRRLIPDAESISSFSDAGLTVICVGLREDDGRPLDEGTLVELAFHKFPSRFSFTARPEFPDTDKIRRGIGDAQRDGLMNHDLTLTAAGRTEAGKLGEGLTLGLDKSSAHESGDLKFAARIERSPAYIAYVENGSLVPSKADELYRMLRVPPTTNPQPVADALRTRMRALARIDRGEIGVYLLELARRHNPNVAALVEENSEAAGVAAGGHSA